MAIGNFRVHSESAAAAICALLSKHQKTAFTTEKTLGGYKILAPGETTVTAFNALVQASTAKPSGPVKGKLASMLPPVPGTPPGGEALKHIGPAITGHMSSKGVNLQQVPKGETLKVKWGFENGPSMKDIEEDAGKKNLFASPDAVFAKFKLKAKQLCVQNMAKAMLDDAWDFPTASTINTKPLATLFGQPKDCIPKTIMNGSSIFAGPVTEQVMNKLEEQKNWQKDMIGQLKALSNDTHAYIVKMPFKADTALGIDVWANDTSYKTILKDQILGYNLAFDGQVPVVFIKVSKTVATLKGLDHWIVQVCPKTE
jgi:hypothetical protein